MAKTMKHRVTITCANTPGDFITVEHTWETVHYRWSKWFYKDISSAVAQANKLKKRWGIPGAPA